MYVLGFQPLHSIELAKANKKSTRSTDLGDTFEVSEFTRNKHRKLTALRTTHKARRAKSQANRFKELHTKRKGV